VINSPAGGGENPYWRNRDVFKSAAARSAAGADRDLFCLIAQWHDGLLFITAYLVIKISHIDGS
jgi:hypothetical protein